MTTEEPRGCACPGQCAAIADLAAERAAKEAAQRGWDGMLEVAERSQDKEAAAIREVEKLRTYNRTFEPLVERLTKERDEAIAKGDVAERELTKERLAAKHALWFREQRDEARERLAQVEADAAALRIAAGVLKHAVYCLRWEDRKHETEAALNTMNKALATNAGKPLLDEVALLRTLLAKMLHWALLDDTHYNDPIPFDDMNDDFKADVEAVRAALADGGKPGPV